MRPTLVTRRAMRGRRARKLAHLVLLLRDRERLVQVEAIALLVDAGVMMQRPVEASRHGPHVCEFALHGCVGDRRVAVELALQAVEIEGAVVDHLDKVMWNFRPRSRRTFGGCARWRCVEGRCGGGRLCLVAMDERSRDDRPRFSRVGAEGDRLDVKLVVELELLDVRDDGRRLL